VGCLLARGVIFCVISLLEDASKVERS
jgi:hypothetical protein